MSALDATQNRLDARDLADILVYIHQFSKQVNFYDFSLEVSNWSVFFEKSAPFILARLARQNTEGVVSEFQQYNFLVKNDPTPANFQLLLDFTYRTTLLDVAALYANTKNVRGFQTVLEQEISSHEMTDVVRQFIGIANAAQHWLCGTKKDFNFLTEDPVWQLDITDIFAQNSLVSSEGGPSVIDTKGSQKQSILAWQRGLEPYFEYFSLVLNRLSVAAETHLNESLYPLETAFKERHEPHLGLLFAFLELFKHLKGQLNSLTAKHLDFYFRQVLKIQSSKAIPDAVHLVLETQKHVQQQLLKRGIEFRDGKDAKGQDILFSLDDEIIVNKAQIKSLKTLFIKKNRFYTEGVFVAPVANSVDGKGMDFKDPMSKNWATLGSNKSKLVPKIGNGSLEATDNPLAHLGFILASPVLFLQEGTRTITIELTVTDTSEDFTDLSRISKPFKVYFSGEKKWIIINNYTFAVNNQLLRLVITLDPTVEPIVHFNAENLKENYDTTLPLVKIEIDQNEKIPLNTEGVTASKCCAERPMSKDAVEVSAYHFLKNVQLMHRKITVQVCGIKKNIIVQNDENVQDVNGLMYPFGTRPEVPDFSVVNGYAAGTRDGSNFYIGSKEIFLKKWKQVNVNLNWKDKPDDFRRYYGAYLKRTNVETIVEDNFDEFGLQNGSFLFNTAYLSKGKWQPGSVGKELFPNNPIETILPEDNKIKCEADGNLLEQRIILKAPTMINEPTNDHDLTLPITQLAANTRDGFVRLTLRNQDFLHKDYPFVLARQMMAFGVLAQKIIVTGAVYMKANKPQVIDNDRLGKKIKDLLDTKVSTTKTAEEVTKFILDINTIIADGVGGVNDWTTKLDDVKTLVTKARYHVTATATAAGNDAILYNLTTFFEGITPIITRIDDIKVASDVKLARIKKLYDPVPATLNIKKNLNPFLVEIRRIISSNAPAEDTPVEKIPLISSKVDNDGPALEADLEAFFTSITDIINLNINNTSEGTSTIRNKSASEIKYDEIVVWFNVAINKTIKEKLDALLTTIANFLNEKTPFEKKYNLIKKEFSDDKAKLDDAKQQSISEKVDALAKFSDAQTVLLNETMVGIGEKVLIPNEPWTPIIKNIALDYAAEADSEDIALIHLYPFEATFKTELSAGITPLLPQLYDEGTLFMGFEQLEPSQNIQILFQLAEATADTEGGRATVKWAYLSNNNDWKPLRTGFEILADATNGLTASGILKLAIPEDIGQNISGQNADNQAITQMPSGQSWLKVASVGNTRAVCEILGIFTQAVRATAQIREGSDTVRLDTPLAAESVGKLAVADAAIKQVVQPFDSFGGRMEETGNTFYLRVSEHLRHKGRAAMPFDYERILLEAFPDIYKAKCIPHSLALPANQFQVDLPKAAGFVTLAVIPDLMRLKSGNLTEPRVALHLLDQITAFLKGKSSPFTRLKVVNPRYEKVNIGFKLKLKKGKDATFYQQQLKTELRLFLAPWSVGDSDKLSFGQPIYYSDILTFIDQREYVDYVKCLTLNLEEKPRCLTATAEMNPSVKIGKIPILTPETGILRPLTPRSVLIAGEITIDILPNTCD